MIFVENTVPNFIDALSSLGHIVCAGVKMCELKNFVEKSQKCDFDTIQKQKQKQNFGLSIIFLICFLLLKKRKQGHWLSERFVSFLNFFF